MKLKTFAAALAATTIAGSAIAADLPSRKVAPIVAAAPVPTWTGFYIGINAGGAFGGSGGISTLGTPTFANPAFLAGGGAVAGALANANTNSFGAGASSGFMLGGQVGVNYQMGSLVAGLEADIAGVFGSKKSASGAVFTTLGPFGFPAENYAGVVSASRKLDYFGTLRARLGFVVTPPLLLYVTGGLAYAGVSANYFSGLQESLGPATYAPVGTNGSLSETRFGWTIGAGGEWKFSPNWSLKAEYLYYDVGTASFTSGSNQINLVAPGTPIWGSSANKTSARFNGHVARAGLNYHFNWNAAPVVARY